MDQLAWQVAGWALTSALGAAVGVLAARARRGRDEDEAMRRGMTALLRAQLIDMHRRYVVEGEPCSVDEHDQCEEVYAAYHALGGNGTGTHLYEEVRRAHVAG